MFNHHPGRLFVDETVVLNIYFNSKRYREQFCALNKICYSIKFLKKANKFNDQFIKCANLSCEFATYYQQTKYFTRGTIKNIDREKIDYFHDFYTIVSRTVCDIISTRSIEIVQINLILLHKSRIFLLCCKPRSSLIKFGNCFVYQ